MEKILKLIKDLEISCYKFLLFLRKHAAKVGSFKLRYNTHYQSRKNLLHYL